jgi:hypothetical protein
MIVFNAVIIALVIHAIRNFEEIKFSIGSKRRVIFNEKFGWKAIVQDFTNQIGYRGKKIEYKESDFIIVLLGDSQVEAAKHSIEEMPESYLQNYLGKGYKVFTVGAGGYGNDQEYFGLKEYFSAGNRADLVILWFTPQNDIVNNMFPNHNINGWGAKPTFTIKNGKLSKPEYRNYTDFEKRLPPPYTLMPYDKNKKYDGIINNHPLIKDYGDLTTEHAHTQVYLDPESERTLYGCRLTNAIIHKIKNLVEKNNCKFTIFYNDFPKYRQFAFRNTNEGTHFDKDGEYLIKPLNASVKFSRAAFDRNIARCLRGIENASIMINNKAPFDNEGNDRHLNNAGNSEVMTKLAKHIKEKGYLRR